MKWAETTLNELDEKHSAVVWYVRLWHALTDGRLGDLANAVTDHHDGILPAREPFETTAKNLKEVMAELRLTKRYESVTLGIELLRLAVALDQKLFEKGEWFSRYPVKLNGRTWGCVPRRTIVQDVLDDEDDRTIGPEEQSAGRAPWFRFGTVIDADLYDVIDLKGPSRTTLENHLENQAAGHPKRVVRVRSASPAAVPMGTMRAVRNGLITVGPGSNDDTIVAELKRIYADAGRAEVAVLTLPELTVSPAALCELLEQSDRPALAVVGLTHGDPAPGSALARNEAVVIDQRGEIIACCAKRTTYAAFDDDTRSHLVREATQIAGENDRLPLIVTPIGVVMPVICLDLFHLIGHRLISDARPALVAVPSLSDKTKPHLKAAEQLNRWHKTVTAVANRPASEARPCDGADCFVAYRETVSGWPMVEAPDDSCQGAREG